MPFIGTRSGLQAGSGPVIGQGQAEQGSAGQGLATLGKRCAAAVYLMCPQRNPRMRSEQPESEHSANASSRIRFRKREPRRVRAALRPLRTDADLAAPRVH